MIQSNTAEGAGRSDSILRAVATAAKRYAGEESWGEVTRPVLWMLGDAANASRAYVFENSTSSDQQLVMSKRYEACRPGVVPTIQDPANQGRPYRPDHARWERVLGGRRTIVGPTREFPDPERARMEREGVRSAAIVPIFAADEWWGFVGFDDCSEERRWTDIEVESLEAASTTLGGAIARERMGKKLEDAEAMYRSYVENIPVITYIEYTDDAQSLGYGTFYISPQIEKILGYKAERFMKDRDGVWWNSIVHPEDVQRIEDEARRTSASGDAFIVDYRVKRSTGDWAWLHDESFLVEKDGERPFWHGVMIDLTDQKNIELDLRETIKKYEGILDLNTEGGASAR